MKKITRLFYLVVLLLTVQSAFPQKYKKVEDTINLNKEYVNVSNDIAEKKAKLTIAQNDLPSYQSKANDANGDAYDAAAASSDQASKATNGSVSEAKSAKRKANKSYDKAKDSRSAKKKLKEQEDKIARYNRDIEKKQHRLKQLDEMRLAIYAKIPAESIPGIQQ